MTPELTDLLAKAKAAYDAMTPEEKWRHRREQAISWVSGEMRLVNNPTPRHEIEFLVDQAVAKGKLRLDGQRPQGKSALERILADEEDL